MGQQRNKRLLITTKSGSFEKNYYKDFHPIRSLFNLDICKDWYQEIIKETSVRDYIKDLKLEFSVLGNTMELSIDNPTELFSNDEIIEAKLFKEQILENDASLQEFLRKAMEANFCRKRFLENKDGSIWVVPTLNDSYEHNNVTYIENLIEWAKVDGADLYLLLHDKDIYSTQDSVSQKKVHSEDEYLSKLLKDKNSTEYKALKELINNGRVFVFIHQDGDVYYDGIVTKGDLNTKNVNNVINILNNPTIANNRILFENVSNFMKKSEIENIIEKNDLPCDFSLNFLK